MLVLSGCVGQPAPSVAAPTLAQAEVPNCRDFTAQVTVGGEVQQAVGQACQQPDGRWRVTQNTPGLPQQVYILPSEAMSLYPYPYAEPYYWDYGFYGGPFFVGGPIFFNHGFHHFHHPGVFFHPGGFFHHGGFAHGGFHGGFHGGGFHGGHR
jgi:hypothetical protein